MAETGVPGSFQAELTNTSQSLSVGQFVQLSDTPGNVGVCLSGGGSRALSAGMGQLRALSYLQVNGKSLLSQTRAISTVSGGSWLGQTFSYLTAGTTDEDYLNQYVPDPGRLVPTRTAGHTTAEILDELPPGNIGNSIATPLFSVPALAVEAFILHKFHGAPLDFLWQALIGLHILKPYGLFNPGSGMLPQSFFSWDQTTLSAITTANPSLDPETAHLIASATDPSRTRRPFPVCNTALFLSEPGTKIRFLAPVQATAFMTGVVGSPTGTDANGRTPGGGGVTSFAFSSNPTAVQSEDVTVTQQRQLALADIVGSSSAAFADALRNQLAEWEQDPGEFFKVLAEIAEDIWDWLTKRLPHHDHTATRLFLDIAPKLPTFGLVAEVKSDLAKLQELIPEYQYWPAAAPGPYPQTLPTQFADGGSLENLGVNAMLSYSDVDNLIVFANTSTPMGTDSNGTVIVTSDIPPLFGYQPYQSGVGYVLYKGVANPVFPQGKNSQVFESSAFDDVLQGLWQASGGGTNQNAAVYKQTLAVQPNPWFGVPGNKTVTVVWVHLNPVKAWYDLLDPSVQSILGPFNDPTSFFNFPNYSTFLTDLKATQINLLANLTSWVVAAEPNQGTFVSLYQGT
jgi:hypothetical protein